MKVEIVKVNNDNYAARFRSSWLADWKYLGLEIMYEEDDIFNGCVICNSIEEATLKINHFFPRIQTIISYKV